MLSSSALSAIAGATVGAPTLPDDETGLKAPPPAKIGDGKLDRFLRKVYRTLRSRQRRHNQHLWPYVSVTRNQAGAISRYRVFGREVALTPLNEGMDPCDEVVHLILSGPSVTSIDYERLDIRAAMGVNGSIALTQRHHVPFRYYCIIDRNFVRRRIDLVQEIVARDLTLYVTPDVLRYMVQGISPATYRCRICVIEVVSQRAFQRRASAETLKRLARANPNIAIFNAPEGLGFSFDMAQGVFDADTVAYAALQVLVAGGARSIYLHGLDLKASAACRFYDEGPLPMASRLVRNFDRLIEPSFRHAAALLQTRGIRLFNLSGNSALSHEVIPKLDWRVLTKP